MKNILQLFIYFLLLISCSKNNETKKSEKVEPILLKIGYYPTFHQPAETILNLNEKYLIFYSPTSYIPEPPPPPKEYGKKQSLEEEKEYKAYLNENPKLIPFKIALSESDIERIQQLTDYFKSEDFSDRDLKPGIDGMSTNIIILYSDGKLVQINPLNAPNEDQKELYSRILNLIIEKNTNKNDSIILQKIKSYH